MVNQLTAWRECSLDNSNKEWLFCLGPSNDGTDLQFNYWYCPTFDDLSPDRLGRDPMTCMPCPGADSDFGGDCQSAIGAISKSYNITSNNHEETVQYCKQLCESGMTGDECTQDASCNPGYFCDFSTKSTSGTCTTCPYNISTCFDEGFASSLSAQRECFNCQLACTDISNSSIQVDNLHYLSSNQPISNAIQASQKNVTGSLMDCSNLILHGVDTCPGAKNHVCLVEDFTADTLFWDLSQKAEDNGCTAIIMLPSGGSGGQHSNDELAIPYVFVSDEEEKELLKSSIGKDVNVGIQIFGSACVPSWGIWGLGAPCNKRLPCAGENEYCDYRKTVKDGEYVEGWCTSCPVFEDGTPDPAGCFFDRSAGSNVKGPLQVQSCASSCMASLWFDDCKVSLLLYYLHHHFICCDLTCSCLLINKVLCRQYKCI
jgi:hypothetical protein